MIFYPETKGVALEDMDALFGKAATARRVEAEEDGGPEDTERLLQEPEASGLDEGEEPYRDASARV